MQGTVADFDAETTTGSVYLDDGTRVTFDAAAFATSSLRMLRLGQRVQLDIAADGRVSRVYLPTMP